VHLVTFASLVVFAEDGAEGASCKLGLALVEVPVLGVVAGLGKCAINQEHDAHGHCDAGELVAPREKCRWLLAEEGHHHVARHTKFMDVQFAKNALQDCFDFVVAEMAVDWRKEKRLFVFSDDGVYDAFECGEGRSEGGEFPKERLKGRYLHREDFVERFILDGPGDNSVPISPGFEPGGRGCAERGHYFSESFAFGFNSGLYPVGKVA
jgi:hypothetical protein